MTCGKKGKIWKSKKWQVTLFVLKLKLGFPNHLLELFYHPLTFFISMIVSRRQIG